MGNIRCNYRQIVSVQCFTHPFCVSVKMNMNEKLTIIVHIKHNTLKSTKNNVAQYDFTIYYLLLGDLSSLKVQSYKFTILI